MTTATEKRIKTNINYLNENQLRKYLASEAISLGRGGIKEVSAISGVHRNTISAGIRELQDPLHTVSDKAGSHPRIRVEGGGRKPITKQGRCLYHKDHLLCASEIQCSVI